MSRLCCGVSLLAIVLVGSSAADAGPINWSIYTRLVHSFGTAKATGTNQSGSGAITGSGSLVKSGSTKLTLSGTSSFQRLHHDLGRHVQRQRHWRSFRRANKFWPQREVGFTRLRERLVGNRFKHDRMWWRVGGGPWLVGNIVGHCEPNDALHP